MMEILFMVFMIIVSIMALFAVMVVFRDLTAGLRRCVPIWMSILAEMGWRLPKSIFKHCPDCRKNGDSYSDVMLDMTNRVARKAAESRPDLSISRISRRMGSERAFMVFCSPIPHLTFIHLTFNLTVKCMIPRSV